MLPWIAATLLGGLVPALIVAGVSASIMILLMALAVTLGHAIVLGLPVALVYRARQWKRLSAVILGAALIGAIPIGLVTWPVSLSFKTTASVDGVATIIDGIPTLAGWLGYLKILATLAALGATGGFVFWLTMRSAGVLSTDQNSATSAHRQRRIVMWLASAAVTASLAVVALPIIAKDRTCHNMFRDGRVSVSSKVNIDLDIAISDWPRLEQLFDKFAASQGMSFRNSSENRPAVVQILGLSACDEKGVVIDTNEQRWASRDYAPITRSGGVKIRLYYLHEDIGWQQLGMELVGALESEWQGKVRFRDSGGRLVPKPAVLKPQTNSQ